MFLVVDYRRNLPHWFPRGASIFLTWRLHGSLPPGFLAHPSTGGRLTAGEEFKRADARLDRAISGPLWLKDPRIASLVVKALERGASELQQYDLHAFAVMANHVHVLLTPKIEVRRLMNGMKGVTARAANKILNRTGKRFWQDESFDHVLRGEESVREKVEYIRQNPVHRGLVSRSEDYPWLWIAPDLTSGII